MTKRTVTVVKRAGPWEVGPIEAFCTDEEIGARMELTEFVKLMAAHLRRPVLIYNQDKLLAALLRAASDAQLSMQQETRRVAK